MAVSEQNVRHLLGELNRSFNNHQLEQLLRAYRDDAILEVEAEGKAFCGKDEIRRHFRELFSSFNDLMFRMDNQIICGDTVVLETLTTGTQSGTFMGIPPTGKHVQFRGMGIFELEGGQIRRHRLYFDRLTVADQLGIAPHLRPQPQMQPWELGPNPAMGM